MQKDLFGPPVQFRLLTEDHELLQRICIEQSCEPRQLARLAVRKYLFEWKQKEAPEVLEG